MAKRGNEVKAPYAKPPEERYRSYRDEGNEADGHKLDS
jgi:hypothetical protein